jgi:hypothetical protein
VKLQKLKQHLKLQHLKQHLQQQQLKQLQLQATRDIQPRLKFVAPIKDFIAAAGLRG